MNLTPEQQTAVDGHLAEIAAKEALDTRTLEQRLADAELQRDFFMGACLVVVRNYVASADPMTGMQVLADIAGVENDVNAVVTSKSGWERQAMKYGLTYDEYLEVLTNA